MLKALLPACGKPAGSLARAMPQLAKSGVAAPVLIRSDYLEVTYHLLLQIGFICAIL